MKNGKIFTICYMTYNRGKTLYPIIKKIFQQIEDNWEILVINNASTKEKKYYEKIAKLSEANINRVRYIENDVNVGFEGNYVKCFEYATSPYIMIMSDEDMPAIDNLIKIVPKIIPDKHTGVVRGSIDSLDGVKRNSMLFPKDATFHAGKQAILDYGLANNYLSGTIYNKDKIIELGILEKVKKNIKKQAVYIHLYCEILTSALLDIRIISNVLSFEGTPVIAIDETGESLNNVNDYSPPYSYGSRTDQFVALRDALYDAVKLYDKQHFDNQLFIGCFLKLVDKYFRLIALVNSPMYKNNYINIDILVDSFYYFACASIINYKHFLPYQNELVENIKNIYQKYIS